MDADVKRVALHAASFPPLNLPRPRLYRRARREECLPSRLLTSSPTGLKVPCASNGRRSKLHARAHLSSRCASSEAGRFWRECRGWGCRGSIPPHPDPLPWGEGEPFAGSRACGVPEWKWGWMRPTNARRPAAPTPMAQCCRRSSPRPEGEGQGEGKTTTRQSTRLQILRCALHEPPATSSVRRPSSSCSVHGWWAGLNEQRSIAPIQGSPSRDAPTPGVAPGWRIAPRWGGAGQGVRS